jgi:hypothetical protein
MDDEFDGASLDGKWSFHAGDDSTFSFEDGCLVAEVPSAVRIEQPISGTAWKCRAKLWIPGYFSANNQVLSMYVRDTVSTSALDIGFWRDGIASTGFFGNRFTTSFAWQNTWYTESFTNAWVDALQPWYFELEYASGTLYWRRCLTGHNKSYYPPAGNSVAASAHLGRDPDRIGFYLSGVRVAMIDWFRRIS